MTVAELTLCGAVWVLAGPRGSPRRARRRLVGASSRQAPRGSAPSSAPTLMRPLAAPSALVRVAGTTGVVLLAVTMLGAQLGVLVGVPAAIAAWVVIARLEPAQARRRRADLVRDLPCALDLLAACLAAGTPLGRALHVVGAALDGEVGGAFGRAGTALGLGATVAEVAAGWRREPCFAGLEPLARVLVRSATSGTSTATACHRLAGELRDERRWHVDAVARRVGVRATAPLGLCFLPAFVLLGIVPIVLAGARSVLS